LIAEILSRWLFPVKPEDVEPYAVDWIFSPDEDNDEESETGFNDPSGWEPGDQDEDEEDE